MKNDFVFDLVPERYQGPHHGLNDSFTTFTLDHYRSESCRRHVCWWIVGTRWYGRGGWMFLPLWLNKSFLRFFFFWAFWASSGFRFFSFWWRWLGSWASFKSACFADYPRIQYPVCINIISTIVICYAFKLILANEQKSWLTRLSVHTFFSLQKRTLYLKHESPIIQSRSYYCYKKWNPISLMFTKDRWTFLCLI